MTIKKIKFPVVGIAGIPEPFASIANKMIEVNIIFDKLVYLSDLSPEEVQEKVYGIPWPISNIFDYYKSTGKFPYD